jgi:hypothetical protein
VVAPRGSFSQSFNRPEPSRVPKEPILAVGWSVLVRFQPGAVDGVALTDEDGTRRLATVEPGAEVEITAWRPRRAAPALYRVRTKDGSKEGWVSAASLERPPAPPPPQRVQPPKPVASPVAPRAAAKTPGRPRKRPRR